MEVLKHWAVSLVFVVLTIFTPVKAMVITTITLIMCDLILGMIAAMKRKETITSTRLKRTGIKLFVYPTAILLGFLTQQYLTGDSVPVTNITAGMLGLTELLSCLENLNDISGQNLLKALIDKIGSQER